MGKDTHPVNILMILDGWGIREEKEGNAFALANTPFIDSLIRDFPSCKLVCSGRAVGLPSGTMGNSEVGHMNIGAGRCVMQTFVRIDTAIEDLSFFKNPAFSDIMAQVSQEGKSLHLMGLLSDGGVHSHISHLFALIDMARQEGVKHLFVHAILDGRDTSPFSGITYMQQLQDHMNLHGYGQVATIVGRYWAMDRDTRWDRVERAYDLFTSHTGKGFDDPVNAIQNAYDSGTTDEFVEPIFITTRPGDSRPNVTIPDETIPDGRIAGGDGVIFFNFRADRAKEITRALTEKNFTQFTRKKQVRPAGFVCMSQYDESFDLPVAFTPQHLENILGQVLSKHNIPQLRIAETEKYAHVTYFFNGGDEQVFEGEERILIPSPRDVATYDEKPEMSAFEVADTACEKIRSGQFGFVLLNFANMDMVGHTGILPAAVTACETVDACVQRVVTAIWETGGTALVTADHGNSEQMIADDGSVHTAHTLNPVRLILAGNSFRKATIKDGILGDIAPTILKIMEIEQPIEMTGTSLI